MVWDGHDIVEKEEFTQLYRVEQYMDSVHVLA